MFRPPSPGYKLVRQAVQMQPAQLLVPLLCNINLKDECCKETAIQVPTCFKFIELLTVHELLDTSFTSSYSNLLNTFQGPSSTSAEARILPLKQVTLVNALQRLRSNSLSDRSSVYEKFFIIIFITFFIWERWQDVGSVNVDLVGFLWSGIRIGTEIELGVGDLIDATLSLPSALD